MRLKLSLLTSGLFYSALFAQPQKLDIPVQSDSVCQSLLVEAEKLYNESKFEEAGRLCTNCIELNKNPWAYFLRAHTGLHRRDTLAYCVDMSETSGLSKTQIAEFSSICVLGDSGTLRSFGMDPGFFPGVETVAVDRWRRDSTEHYTLYDAQDSVRTAFVVIGPDTFYSVMDKDPEFTSDPKGFLGWLEKNLPYPEYDPPIEGRVWVEFIVNSQGNVVQPTILRSPSPILSEIVLTALQKIPQWKPGEVFGRTVSMRYRFPIVF